MTRHLTFTDHRRLAVDYPASEAVRTQLEVLAAYTNSPEWIYELVDAVDDEGVLRYRVAFFPIGEVVVFYGDTTAIAATSSQHVVRTCRDRAEFELWTDLEAAYHVSSPPIDEAIEFRQADPEVSHPRLGTLRFDDAVWSRSDDDLEIGVGGVHAPEPAALDRAAALLDDAELAAAIRAQFGDGAAVCGVWLEDGDEKLGYRVGGGELAWCAVADL